jgi:hypothetical protein
MNIKRLMAMLIVISIVFSGYRMAQAQQDKESLKKELADVRNKKAMALVNLNKGSHDLLAEHESKISVIKETYRKAHNECMSDMHEKERQLRKDYEAQMSQLNKEESRLIGLVGSDARDNFAKTRAD